MSRISSSQLLFGLVALIAVVDGCATWKSPRRESKSTTDEPVSPSQSPHPVIELEFITLPVESRLADESLAIWRWVDETRIDLDSRRSLLENGIRVGFVANDEVFRGRLENLRVEGDAIDQFLTQASVASEVSHGKQRIPMRYAKRYEVPLRQPIEGNHVVLAKTDGQAIGRTLHRAQYLLALTGNRTDSTQRLQLTIRPEIQHGQMRPQWVSSDSAIRIDARRETWSFEDLSIDVTCGLGETLVIGSDGAPRGLAKSMLTGEGSDHGEQQVVVLLTVANLPEIDPAKSR